MGVPQRPQSSRALDCSRHNVMQRHCPKTTAVVQAPSDRVVAHNDATARRKDFDAASGSRRAAARPSKLTRGKTAVLAHTLTLNSASFRVALTPSGIVTNCFPILDCGRNLACATTAPRAPGCPALSRAPASCMLARRCARLVRCTAEITTTMSVAPAAARILTHCVQAHAAGKCGDLRRYYPAQKGR